ncbi:secretin N-terminal domain-containing protein [Geothermobacter hydrogeniphilus]|uniref:NolW-like domain-containing protein n=1 Tax=Geothermobacter hydrogeniphilus TaxID=1969733 RepID=A0A1X0YEM3_9BACT|nr:secretin N-terminal domain-containing protein [Geothermobacter hydrogeniphilus]ORJ63608.1 hypothetical protein B5V00_01715 [Geothermobacter hydrogeniphilus]
MICKNFFLTITLLFLFLLSGGPGLADQGRVFQLQHRSAGELLPLLQPLVDEQTRISGAGQQLVVRGSKDEIQLIAELVNGLDTAVPQFLIQVRQRRSDNQTPSRGRTLGTAGDGDSTTLSTKPGRTIGNSRRSVIQSLRIEDGQKGFLQVGRDEPFSTSQSFFAGEIFGFGENIEYRKVSTGFWVEPSLRGKMVRLRLTPQMEALDSAAKRKTVEFQQAASVIQVPLGVWTNLATSMSDGSDAGRAMLTYKAGHRDQVRDIWIKVDRLKEVP